jgi:hypothetical protein
LRKILAIDLSRMDTCRMPDQIKSIGAIVVTVCVFVAVGFSIFNVIDKIGSVPTLAGGHVILDQFQRAKDIFTPLLALATTAVGYWLGNDGKQKAQAQADAAQDRAKAAHDTANAATKDASEARAHLAALQASAPQEIVDRVRQNFEPPGQ